VYYGLEGAGSWHYTPLWCMLLMMMIIVVTVAGDCVYVSEEMNAQWDIPLHVDTSLAAFVRGVLPTTIQTTDSSSAGSNNRSDGGSHTSAEKRHPSGTTAVCVILILLTCTCRAAYIGESWVARS